MAVVEELLRAGTDAISFGNYELDTKAKLENFEFKGDLYKVKTYAEITKLEKNGMFVYESVPGTTVLDFKDTQEGLTFTVEGKESAQITLELEDDAEYSVSIKGKDMGKMKTNLSGKLNLNLEFDQAAVEVKISK